MSSELGRAKNSHGRLPFIGMEMFPGGLRRDGHCSLCQPNSSERWERIDFLKFRSCPQARSHYTQKQEWQVGRGMDKTRPRH